MDAITAVVMETGGRGMSPDVIAVGVFSIVGAVAGALAGLFGGAGCGVGAKCSAR
jgi:hypothetical protein